MPFLRHVVMWTLNDPADAARFKAVLESCQAIVPGILEFEVGIRKPGLDASCDVVLVSTFVERAALEAYLQHPVHRDVAAVLGPMRRERTVLDYEIPSADVPPADAQT